jgi:hypothetical protein
VKTFRSPLLLAALPVLLFSAAAPAAAQTAPAPGAELRAAQGELFRRMAAAPDNLELMFEYAAVSMRLEDYEAAIATLERMLFFDPDLPRVKLELGVAYYRLGSYEVARTYFEDVLAGDPPPGVVERVQPFLDEIAGRTAVDQFSGFVAAGPLYTTNANLGPNDREIRAEFFPGGEAFIDAEDTAQSDVGLRLTASATHVRDLRRPNADAWISSAVYAGQRFRDEADGDFDALDLTTGPRLALDDRSFGPKLRPYAQLGGVRVSDGLLYAGGGGGVEFTDTINDDLASFAVASLQYRDYGDDDDDFDGVYGFATGGLAYTGLGDATLRGALVLDTDRTREDYNSNVEIGLRVSAAREFTVAESGTFARPWTATAFAQGSGRFFDAPDPVIDADTEREDFDARLGLRVFAPFEGGWGVAADAGYFGRFSNIPNYDVDAVEIGVALVKSF